MINLVPVLRLQNSIVMTSSWQLTSKLHAPIIKYLSSQNHFFTQPNQEADLSKGEKTNKKRAWHKVLYIEAIICKVW